MGKGELRDDACHHVFGKPASINLTAIFGLSNPRNRP
jgi:hypothetical protein